jgi:hypothetical protein
MTLSYTYDGSPLGYPIPPTKISLPSRAELGSLSEGGVSPEDPAAGLSLVGWRPFHVDESDCSQPRLFTGYVADRQTGRSFEQTQFVGPDERIHDTTIADLNAVLGMRIIWDTDGKRPEETMEHRLDWLLTSDYLAGLIADTGFANRTFSLMMDAADYRGAFPDAVLQDLSGRSATLINYFAFWDPTPTTGMQPSLFYNFVGEATFDCTIGISNAGDDNGTTIFEPDHPSRLERTPETVWSDVIVNYANGSVHVYRPATAAAFIRRGTTISRPYTGKSSTAMAQGLNFLEAHATETDRITTAIHVPSSIVGLIQAGMRMPVKFTHMDGPPEEVDRYRDGTSMRIVACTPRPVDDVADWYDVDLELVAPKTAEEPTCPATEPWGSPQAAEFFGASLALTGDPSGPIPPMPPLPYYSAFVYTPPPTPPLVSVVTWGVNAFGAPAQSYGIPDSGGYWGMMATVGGGQAWGAAWTFDLGAPQKPCMIIHLPGFGPGGGDGFPESWLLESSNDLVTWDLEVDTATLAASGFVLEAPDLAPAAAKRYWRFTWSKTVVGGLVYIGGIDMTFINFYLDSNSGSAGDLIPPTLGTTVTGETPSPTPTGTTVTFTLASAYLPGSLQVAVDGIPIPASEIAETDPVAGTFTLSWAPDSDEKITVTYRVG